MSRFVWYDLMTTDLKQAKTFYGSLIGWTPKAWTPEYELWSIAGTDVGGLMALPEDARKAGAPPMWLGYVGTADVDGAAKKAQQLGGRVQVPPRDIPNVGRFAILVDPQGAMFAIFQPSGQGSAPDTRGVGHFSWAELNTTDWKAAWKFYSELFGWKKTSSMDMGAEYGEYFMFGEGGEQSMGGMSNAATMMKAPAHWLHYVNVPSVDEAAKRIPTLGGKVMNGPMDVPGGDRIAQCMDPQGGMFAIFSPGKK